MDFAASAVGAEAVSSGFEGAESLLERLFKISADSHNFADGLHLSGQS